MARVSSRLTAADAALVRKAKKWQLVGDPPSDVLTGLGDHDLTDTWRDTYVSRHDLPNLGAHEVPLEIAAAHGGGGTGPSNGLLCQIIQQTPEVVLAAGVTCGFTTCVFTGDDYVRWQKWRTRLRPGWRWCAECDRSVPPTWTEPHCGRCVWSPPTPALTLF